MTRKKVFCVGWQKTGTTSFKNAMAILGYQVWSFQKSWNREGIGDEMWDLARQEVPRYDAFADNPWPLLYERLDQEFPGSLFVLTTRAPRPWIRSVIKHFGSSDIPMHRVIYGEQYGRAKGNEEVYIRRMLDHEQSVRSYFATSDQFLDFPIVDGAGWDQLCPFLDIDIPSTPFPHSNRGSARAWKRTKAIPSKVWNRLLGR